MNSSPQRRGLCPSVWTPLASGDGLIVRVHPGAGELSARSLRQLVELAAGSGNGQIELTRRANLQLRGIGPATLPGLRAALIELALAASAPALDAGRVLLVDPLAGLAPDCPPLQRLARQIAGALQHAALPAQLPEKFGIVLDAGGGLLEGVAADVRLRVHGAWPERAQIEVLGGGRALAAGVCATERAAALLLRVLQLLASEAGRAGWRALDAARRSALRVALERLLAADGERPAVATGELHAERAQDAHHARDGVETARRAERPPAELIGSQVGWFGVGVPFGSGDAALWRGCAELADSFGDGTLRTTPQRVLLLPGTRSTDGPRLAEAARALGLIVDARDPLLRVSACPGAPACSAALGETRALARSLCHGMLPMLSQTATLHVSGCPKSCASSRAADVTVVHDVGGSKLGFGVDAAQAAREPALLCAPPPERLLQLLLAALSARRAGSHDPAP